MKIPIKAVIFDLDGVLVTPTGELMRLRPRLIEFLQKKGADTRNYDLSDTSAMMILKFEEELVRKGVSSREIDKNLEDIENFLNELELGELDMVSAMPGARNLLQVLRKNGVRIGVLTRACREYTEGALKKANMIDLIDAIVVRERKSGIAPKPSPEAAFALLKMLDVRNDEAVMIGDYSIDYDCARKSSLEFFGIASSEKSLNDLRECDCRIILNSLDEFRKQIGFRIAFPP